MGSTNNAGGLRKRRGTFVFLFLLCAGLAGGSILMQSDALETERADASAHAQELANDGVASTLGPRDLEGPIAGAVAHDLTDRLKESVLTAGTSRVRIWSPDGDLLYSSDATERLVSVSPSSPDAIRTATKGPGRAASLVSVDRPQMLETYVPLRPGNAKEPLAAVEIDQAYAPMVATSQEPWNTIRTFAIAGSALFLLLTIGSFVPVVGRKPKVEGGFVGPKSPVKSAIGPAKVVKPGPSATEDRAGSARELERAISKAERAEAARAAMESQMEQLRSQIRSADGRAQARIAELEQSLRQSQARVHEASTKLKEAGGAAASGVAGAGGPDPAVQSLQGRVRELEETLQAARGRLTEMETRAREAEAKAASSPTSGSGGVPQPDQGRPVTGLEARELAAEARAVDLETAVGELEATLKNERARIGQLESSIGVLENERAEFRSGLMDLESQKSALQARVAELETAHGAASGTQVESATREPDLQRLRAELAEAIERTHTAEERAARAEADLAAVRSGVNPEVDDRTFHDWNDDAPVPSTDGIEEAAGPVAAGATEDRPRRMNLRSRLAQTTTRRKVKGSDDDWF